MTKILIIAIAISPFALAGGYTYGGLFPQARRYFILIMTITGLAAMATMVKVGIKNNANLLLTLQFFILWGIFAEYYSRRQTYLSNVFRRMRESSYNITRKL